MLKRLLIDSEFCFAQNFFADVFVRVDVLYNAFQSHLMDGATAKSHVSEFCDIVSYTSNRTYHLKATKSLYAAAGLG